MADQNCLFCRIARHEVPATIRYEDDDVIAFDDIHPSAPTHILLVPKKHIVGAETIGAGDGGALLAMFRAAQKLIAKLNLDGQFKLVINGGAFRHVNHLHAHLLSGELSGPLP